VRLDPAVEAVLAWTVREGATNVIRHSGAHHCTLRVTATLSDAGVEVIDDGRGVNGNGAGWEGAGAVTGGDAATGGESDPSHAGVPSPRVARNGAGNAGGPHAADNAGGPRATGGHGIAGLAERARTLNGTVVAGALDGGGFRLAVTVPVPVRRA
jgi:two-component system sensor histidine kinase DesK